MMRHKKKDRDHKAAYGLLFTRSLERRLPRTLISEDLAGHASMAAAPQMHYSVPPRTPFNEDQATCTSPFCLSPNRKYHVYGGASEFSSRLTARQSSPAKVIGIDGKNVQAAGRAAAPPGGRGTHGFFPPVKLRNAADTGSPNVRARSISGSDAVGQSQARTSPFHFELAPQPKKGSNPRPAKKPKAPPRSPEGSDSDLVHQKLVLATRSNPWVYRYKVKKSLNELNRILSGSVSLPGDFPTL